MVKWIDDDDISGKVSREPLPSPPRAKLTGRSLLSKVLVLVGIIAVGIIIIKLLS